MIVTVTPAVHSIQRNSNNNKKTPQASKEYAVGYEKNKKSNTINQDRQKSGILKIGDRAENCDPCNHP